MIHEKWYRSLFENTESLYNIATGITTGPKVNADRTEIIGNDIVVTIVDQNVFEFSFQHKNQATNMQTIGVIIGEEPINIDPQLLFQHLIVINDHHEYTVKPVYKDRSRDQKKAVFIDRWSLYEGSRFYMSTSNLTV